MTTTQTTTDLTAKARIRIAALELFAEYGVATATMRQVAQHAGVTVGLVTHHYGSKEALRDAVDEYVVDAYRDALAAIPPGTTSRELTAVRDRNVAQMLLRNDALQKYVRRAYLEPFEGDNGVLERLVNLTTEEVRRLRADGIASSERSETEQVLQVVTRQIGELLMQPVVDRVWRYLDGAVAPSPRVRVTVEPVVGSTATSDQPSG